MAKVDGRRPDETAQPSSQKTGPEKWVAVTGVLVAVAIVLGLLVLAS